MSLAKAIKNAVRPPSSHASAFGDPFVELDREATARELRLSERGRENGSLNLPPPGVETLDAVETDIVATVGNTLARAQNEAAAELGEYARRVNGLDRLRSVSTIDGAARAAVADIGAAASLHRSVLIELQKTVEESAVELAAFRKHHALARPAIDPAPGSAVWGAILVTAAVELGFNAFFLRDDLGLLGGFVSALVITAINSFLLGWLGGRLIWPSLQYKSKIRLAIAWPIALAWMAAAIVWNLLAAHYRLAKLANDPSPERGAVTRFLVGPFSLSDMQTLAFFVIGVFVAFIAAAAFYKMDDPYPGYGPITRRHAQRFEDHEAEVEQTVEELRSLRDDATTAAVAQRDALAVQFGEYRQVVNGYNRYMAQYRDHLARLQRDVNALLEAYRNANRAARTADVPPHFNRPYAFPPDVVVESVPLPVLPADLDAQVTEAGRRLDAAIAAINDAFEREVARLRPEPAHA